MKTNTKFLALTVIGLIVIITRIHAQTMLQIGNSAYIYVKPIGSMYIDGNTTVAGLFQNQGKITFKKDVTILGGLHSSGTEFFSGTNNQMIKILAAATCSFGDLYKSNIGIIVCDGSITAKTITWNTDGIIQVTASNIVTITDNTQNAIIGFSPDRYFLLENNSGSLNRAIGSTTTFTFPVGNTAIGYHRIDLNFLDLGSTGPNFVSVKTATSPGNLYFNKYYTTGFSGNTPGICTSGGNPQWVEFTCLKNDFWRFTGASDYQYTAYAYTSGCPGGQGPRRLVFSPPGTNDWVNHIEDVIGSIEQNLCEYSDWTGSASVIPGGKYLGATMDIAIAGGYGAPLPVELLWLDAKPIENKFIQVSWQTASELNNEGFTIERSTDNSNWIPIGWKDGNGTTNTIHSYSFDDYGVDPNVLYYYRLKQKDFNNKTKLSNTVSAKIISVAIIVSEAVPNPSSDIRTVTVYLPKPADIYAQCFNDIGQIVMQQTITGVVGNNSLIIQQELPKGWYVLKINIDDYQTVKKFITQ